MRLRDRFEPDREDNPEIADLVGQLLDVLRQAEAGGMSPGRVDDALERAYWQHRGGV